MKKIISLMILAAFLMSIVGIAPVSAASAAVYTDDFSGTFGSNSFTSDSEIFSGGQGNGTYAASTAGYNGTTTALNVAANGTGTSSFLGTKSFSSFGMTQSSAIVFNTRIKFIGDAVDGTQYMISDIDVGGYRNWTIYGGDDGRYHVKFWSDDANVFGKLNPDTWYDFSIKIAGNQAYNYIYNSETGEQVLYHNPTVANDASVVPSKRLLFRISNLTSDGVLFDDAKLYRMETTDSLSSVFEGTTAENTVIDTEGTITVKFDQPVTPSASDFVVKDKNSNAVTDAVKGITVKDFNTVAVKLAGLKKGASYSLDYSKVTSASGIKPSDAATIAFKTTEPAEMVSYTENFNNVPVATGSFGSSVNSTISEIFWDGAGNGSFETAAGYDKTPNSALKLVQGTTSGQKHFRTKAYINNFGLSSSTKLVFNMRFKAVGAISDSLTVTMLTAGGSNSGFLEIKGDTAKNTYYVVKNATYNGKGDRKDIQADRWYNLTVSMALASDNTTLSAVANVYDSVTGEHIIRTVPNNQTISASSYMTFIGNNFGEGAGVLFDDAKMYCVYESNSFAYDELGSTEANAEIEPDGEITVKFNQPITANTTMFTVKDSDGNAVSGAVESVKIKNFDTAVVKVKSLAHKSSYKLSFENLTSAAGKTVEGTKEIAFKTKQKTLYVQNYTWGTKVNKNVFLKSSEIWNDGQGNSTYSEAEGYSEGEKGVKNSTASETAVSAHVKTYALSNFGLSDTTSLILTTRFKVEGESASNVSWSVNPGSGVAAFCSINGGIGEKYYVDAEPITAGKWYNITAALHTTGRNSIIVNDSETGKLIVHKSSDVLTNQASRQFLIQTNNLVKGSSLTVADTKIHVVKNTDTVKLISEGTTAEGTEIPYNGSIILAFDKPVLSHKVDGTGASTVPSKNNFKVDGADVGEIGVIDFNKVVISFYNIDDISDYVLDYSDIRFEGGAGLDSSCEGKLAFKTGIDNDNVITMKGGAAYSTEAGGTVKFELYSKADANPAIMVAFYNKDILEGVEIFENAKAIAAGATEEVSVTLKENHTADTIKIFAWETPSSMQPLMRNKNIIISAE